MKTYDQKNINWFKKLPLSKKLECIEEQFRTVNYFRTLKNAKQKNLHKRNSKKVQ